MRCRIIFCTAYLFHMKKPQLNIGDLIRVNTDGVYALRADIQISLDSPDVEDLIKDQYMLITGFTHIQGNTYYKILSQLTGNTLIWNCISLDVSIRNKTLLKVEKDEEQKDIR